MFGQSRQPLCSQCDAWCLRLLSEPPKDTGVAKRDPSDVPLSKQPLLYCTLQVPKECAKCRPSGCTRFVDFIQSDVGFAAKVRTHFDRKYPIGHRIVLPAKFVADGEHLLNMSRSNIDWGTKGPNTELQLANLAGGVRLRATEDYQYAFLKIAPVACRAANTANMVATSCCCCTDDSPVATAWRPYDVGKTQVVTAGSKSDDDPPGVDVDDDDDPIRPGLPGCPDAIELTTFTPKPRKSDLELAILAEEKNAQAGAHLSGSVIVGTTVSTANLQQNVAGGMNATVANDAHAVLPTDGDAATGVRTAFTRFPQVTDEKVYVFNNDAVNLEAAHAMRNQGVGVHVPTPVEVRKARIVLDALKRELVRVDYIEEALKEFEQYWDTLPSKFSGKTRQSVFANVSNEAQFDFTTYCLRIKAFIKAEASRKEKPRPIADHGMERLVPLAKVAWIFEKLMCRVSGSNIKGRAKEKALYQLFNSFTSIDDLLMLIENDLTGFEWGVIQALKELEAELLKHIASFLRLEGFELAFERIVDSRTQAATWVMHYTDAAGAKCKISIKLPRAMRESGDRLTSSGNWLQNVIAWFVFLCDEATLDEAVTGWVKSRGRNFFYVSPREGVDPKTGKAKKHLARLGFEGDDTAGGLSEAIPKAVIEEFFARWGWKPKIRVVEPKGYDYLEFVGERALMKDLKPVIVDGRLVSAPPIKRLFHEKAWCTSNMLDKDKPGSLKLYAIRLAQQYRSVPPMYAFARAMYQDNKHGQSVDKDAMADYLRSLGDVGFRPNLSKFPEPEGAHAEVWSTWAEVTAGKASDLEIANMCGLTTLKQHGFDFQAVVPSAWRDA